MTWVQVPYTRIEERHAWDCHRRISGAALYKPMRHFEHHKNAGKRYWVLETSRAAPMPPPEKRRWQRAVACRILPALSDAAKRLTLGYIYISRWRGLTFFRLRLCSSAIMGVSGIGCRSRLAKANSGLSAGGLVPLRPDTCSRLSIGRTLAETGGWHLLSQMH